MKKKVTNLYQKAAFGVACVRSKVCAMCTRKAEGASHTTEILLAVIVALGLAFIFKEKIIAFINSIMAQLNTEAVNLF